MTGHPHACGEHHMGRLRVALSAGPSPRLWGTRLLGCCAHGCSRAIPTPVGNTKIVDMDVPTESGHPHACGEHLRGPRNRTVRNGPSPRLWGTRAGTGRAGHPRRAIPTPVGNTSSSAWPVGASPGHPHACGEHEDALHAGDPISGPSPRLWGTLLGHAHEALDPRAIPTPVGNTTPWA